jgi:hypothetical protein
VDVAFNEKVNTPAVGVPVIVFAEKVAQVGLLTIVNVADSLVVGA